MVFKITINEQTEYIDAKSITRISAMTENSYREDNDFFPRTSFNEEYQNYIKTSVINYKLSFNIDLKDKHIGYSIIMCPKTDKEATKARFKEQYFKLIGYWMQCLSNTKYTLPDSIDFKFPHIGLVEEKTEDSEMDIKDIKETINLIKTQIS